MMYIACFFNDLEITFIISSIRSAIPDGSYIIVTHDTLDGHKGETEMIAKVREIYDNNPIPLFFRDHEQVSRIFQGLHSVEPGIVFLDERRVELDLPAPVAV